MCGDEHDGEQMTAELSPVNMIEQSSTQNRLKLSRTEPTSNARSKVRGTTERPVGMISASSTDRQNVVNNEHSNERRRVSRLDIDDVLDYEFSSRTPRSKINLSERNKIFIAVVVCLTIFSITVSSYVGYQVLIRDRDCDCSDPNSVASQSGMPFATVSGVSYELKKNTIKQFIEDFRKELQEVTNQTDDMFDSTCKKNTADCFKERIENLSTRLREAKTEVESLLNKTNERTTNELEMTRTRAQELKNMQDPQCMLKKNERRSNQALVMVLVKTRNVVILGVTCSTSTTYPAKVWYLAPPTKYDDNYKCYCHSDDGKTIDCVAYYWQCKLP